MSFVVIDHLKNSEHIKFNENAVVILNDKLEPFGTRVIGPVLKEIQKYYSLVSESFITWKGVLNIHE